MKKKMDWLKIGTEVEMEHHMGKAKARKIALDHIKELGNGYYPALLKMEASLKKKNKKVKK